MEGEVGGRKEKEKDATSGNEAQGREVASPPTTPHRPRSPRVTMRTEEDELELERELEVLYISPERPGRFGAPGDRHAGPQATAAGLEAEPVAQDQIHAPKPVVEIGQSDLEDSTDPEEVNMAGAGLVQRLSIWCRENARKLAATLLCLHLWDNVNIVDKVAEMVLGRKGE